MTSKRLMASVELDHRVREHGGIIETIEWGVTSDSIEDAELAAVWRGIEEHYADLRSQLVVASRMLVASRRAA